jgi:bis(5'-nucleosyl)-tetraphosphatase (symmetrical)
MSTYVVGDVHGCCSTLEALLSRVHFSRGDRLWLVGDLVNRGPDSLAVLRLARRLGERCVCTLGNHDLHLLARAEGLASAKARDTLEEVLGASDRGALLRWLSHRALMHRSGKVAMVHAGMLPGWSVAEAERRARALERTLRGERRRELLAALVGTPEDERSASLAHDLAIFTRLRTCTPGGAPRWGFDGAPEQAPRGAIPWFRHPARRTQALTVHFGHWAALGLHLDGRVRGLDSGCVWGRALTAVRLEDRAVFQVASELAEA